MRLLATSLLVASLAFGCSNVRRVDDDGFAGTGGSAAGAGGSPATAIGTPAGARLFACADGPQAEDGVQFWNDPDERGIDRAPDGHIAVDLAFGLASVGGRLFVEAQPGLLYVFDDVWGLESGAAPTEILEIDASVSISGMRAIAELDLLWVESASLHSGAVFQPASQLTVGSQAVKVDWADPVYDPVRDRLFVVEDGAIRVIEGASSSTTLEADWALYEIEDHAVNRLVSDGTSLFALGGASDQLGASSLFAWRLDAQVPTAAADLDAGAGQALAPIPGGGVVSVNDIAIFSWDGASPSSPELTAITYFDEPNLSWYDIVVSQNRRVYIAGDVIWAFDSPSLGEPSARTSGGPGLLLIERDLDSE